MGGVGVWKHLRRRTQESRRENEGDLVHYRSIREETFFFFYFFGALLPNLVIFSARVALLPSFYLCFFISPLLHPRTPPPSIPLPLCLQPNHYLSKSSSLFFFFADTALSGFLMRCQLLR